MHLYSVLLVHFNASDTYGDILITSEITFLNPRKITRILADILNSVWKHEFKTL